MSYWDLREWIESVVPWWAPFAAIAVFGPLIVFGPMLVHEWRRKRDANRSEVD